jgi:hypothetical protein
MEKPHKSAQVALFIKTRAEYLDALSELHTSLDNLSDIQAGIRGHAAPDGETFTNSLKETEKWVGERIKLTNRAHILACTLRWLSGTGAVEATLAYAEAREAWGAVKS